jgi:hypothetical protein
MNKPFLWLNRFLAGAQLVASRTERILSELPVVLSTPELAERATFDYFDRSQRYASAAQQLLGLYPFERRVVDRFFPKPPARIVAHGVGGGRELVALLDLGYSVEAYEPIPRLADAATKLARGRFPATYVGAKSIQAWTPGGPVDAVFLGWTAYSHLLSQAERLSALTAFRAACPSGPVLLSFYTTFALHDTTETAARQVPLHPTWEDRIVSKLRDGVRVRLLGRAPVERGTAWMKGFFFHQVERWELEEEAAASRYRVAYFEEDPRRSPHAVLVPTD